jgi:hypothetical protein
MLIIGSQEELAVEEVELQTLVLLLEMISIVPHTKTEK